MTNNYMELDKADFPELAMVLGDTPETVISVHLLRRGLCKAYVAGSPSCPEAVIIQGIFDPKEPAGFGHDSNLLWELLKSLENWDCVDVGSTCAKQLGYLIQKATGAMIRYYGDVYHTLTKPMKHFSKDNVRLLTPEDHSLIESAPSEIQGAGFEDLTTMLSEGIVAGAIESNRLVAIAHTSAITEIHGDIGVGTLGLRRGQGYSTAAASIVADRLQEIGRIPVWSSGEGNYASLRVAKKLGFQEVSRKTYVILEKDSG